MIDIDKYLIHSADVYHVRAARDGSVFSAGSADIEEAAVPTACFAYFGSLSEINDILAGLHGATSGSSKWQVILPASFINTIKEGALITNILDESNQPIREQGYVKELSAYRHHYYGPQFVVVKLAE
jgi:hypothetical protein